MRNLFICFVSVKIVRLRRRLLPPGRQKTTAAPAGAPLSFSRG